MTNTKTAKPTQSEQTINNIKAAHAKLERCFPHTLGNIDGDNSLDFSTAIAALARIIEREEGR